MTLEEFEALPYREGGWDSEVECSGIVILPCKELHDSGYRCMDFVAVSKGEPICRLSGCSDVIHVDGIGGYGHDWLEEHGHCPSLVPPSSWSIDCLPKSGLLHMWPASHKMIAGHAFSSFEIFAQPRDKR